MNVTIGKKTETIKEFILQQQNTHTILMQLDNKQCEEKKIMCAMRKIIIKDFLMEKILISAST